MDSTLAPGTLTSSATESRRQARWFAGRQGRKLKEALLAYLFLFPAFLIIGTFGIFPLLFAAYESSLKGINDIAGRYDGLGNYLTAIDTLIFVLGFWGAVGLLVYALYSLVQARNQAAAKAQPFWPWLAPGVLMGAAGVLGVTWLLRLLPLFLEIPGRLRGARATRADFRAAAWDTLLLPQVQIIFWAAIVVLVVGILLNNLVIRSQSERSTITSYRGHFSSATLMLALSGALAYLTWTELSTAYAAAAEGAGLTISTQILTISAGLGLLLLSWFVWGSAGGRSSTAGMALRLVGAALLMVAAWVLIAELPMAIARGDSLWWDGLLATIYYSIGTIPAQLLIALALAALLFQKIKGRSLFRMLYFLPYIAPFVGTAAVFQIIFSSRPTGPINSIITALGPRALQWLAEPRGIFQLLSGSNDLPGWASGPSLALIVIMIYGVWTFFGFNTVIFLAGLGAIPAETYEAAAIDGAGRWAQFRHITLPLLSPTIYFLTLYSVIGTFKAFNHIYVLRTGAALGTTDTASVIIFQTFKRDLRFGYASALAILLLLIILVLTVVNNRIASKRVFYG